MVTFVIHRSDGRVTVAQTCDFGFEGAAHYVLRSAVFDGDEIVARRHRRVCDPVPFWTLSTVHLHLGRAVDVDRQSAGAGVAGVDHELRGHTWRDGGQVLIRRGQNRQVKQTMRTGKKKLSKTTKNLLLFLLNNKLSMQYV